MVCNVFYVIARILDKKKKDYCIENVVDLGQNFKMRLAEQRREHKRDVRNEYSQSREEKRTHERCTKRIAGLHFSAFDLKR